MMKMWEKDIKTYIAGWNKVVLTTYEVKFGII